MYVELRSGAEKFLAAALVGLISPLLLAVAIVIRVTMGNPVLFMQRRVGRHGRLFTMLKFRTMVRRAEEVANQCNPIEAGLVPPLGRLLRRLSLDELPQLFNIIKGDMSFVGPRPMLPIVYQRCDDLQRQRSLVPPGVTGLAQLRYRNNAPWSVRVASDLEYVLAVSFGLDLFILRKTIVKVFRSEDVRLDQRADDVVDLTGGDEAESVSEGSGRDAERM